jgi:hypothetical protein
MLSGEAANSNSIVLALTQPGLEPTITSTFGMYANHYIINAVIYTLYKTWLTTFGKKQGNIFFSQEIPPKFIHGHTKFKGPVWV